MYKTAVAGYSAGGTGVASRFARLPTTWPPGTFLAGLAPDAVDDLLAHVTPRQFAPGTALFREGNHDTHVELLLSGFVKVTTIVDGIEVLLGIRLPGEILGEAGALTGEPRSASVTTCGLLMSGVISRAEFEAFLRRHPTASSRVTATVAAQLRWANRRRIDFGAYPADKRLARLLSDIADMCGTARPDGGVDIAVPLSQPELASMIAIAQATVQKAIQLLRARNLIRTGYRRLTIVNPDALKAYCADIP